MPEYEVLINSHGGNYKLIAYKIGRIVILNCAACSTDDINGYTLPAKYRPIPSGNYGNADVNVPTYSADSGGGNVRVGEVTIKSTGNMVMYNAVSGGNSINAFCAVYISNA